MNVLVFIISPDFWNLSLQMSALYSCILLCFYILVVSYYYLPPNINVTSSIEMLILDGSVSEFLKELHRTYLHISTVQKLTVWAQVFALEIWHMPFNPILHIDNSATKNFPKAALASNWGQFVVSEKCPLNLKKKVPQR